MNYKGLNQVNYEQQHKKCRMINIKYVLFCIIWGIVSCSTDYEKKELVELTDLTGEWLMSSSFGAMCNICPEVIIIDSMKGRVIKPSKESYDFRYKTQKDKISFHFEETNVFSNLNSEFNFMLKSHNGLRYLILKTLDDNGEIILISE